MAEINYTPKKYLDGWSSFASGIDSLVEPLQLQKDQLGIGINVSLRGDFVHPRPPFIKKTLDFSNSPGLNSLLATGFFQGAGYYRPDFGTELLLASINGRLLTFTEESVGGAWAVSEVTIPNDPNSATQQQCWMWQAEKWMIVNDGSGKLPIFFDGLTCRRSFGPSQLLGIGIAFTPSTPPAIGSTVKVTLAAPFLGVVNTPVIFNGAFYEVILNPAGYPATLTNITGPAGSSIPSGTQIIFNPMLAAITINNGGGNSGTISWNSNQTLVTASLAVDSFAGISIGNQLSLSVAGTTYSLVVRTLTISGGRHFINATTISPIGSYHVTVPIGTTIQFQFVTAPSAVVGTTSASFTVPAVNGAVAILLVAPYIGTNGERVTIAGATYLISGSATQPPSTTLFLLNNADTSGNAYSNPSNIMSVPELPAGRMGAYGMGRNWFSLTNGTTYEAGDIVGGGSGTSAFNFRDAVLRTTENDFLAGGGVFTLPGTGDVITAMLFPPVLDSSLGVGSLQIFTPFSVFANNAPADRTTWINLTWPIQSETLKDQGARAQNSTVLVNSDVFFMSDFNIASLVLARREFRLNQWGNKPISSEVQRILQLNNQSLLSYGSGVSFDNRFLMSAVPSVLSQGVLHSGLISLNFDPLSSLRTNDPPAWEGAWSGVNVMQILTGRVNGTLRCFAFTYNITTAQIELYELLSEATAIQQGIFSDNQTTPIGWMFETPVLFNADKHPLTELIQLRDGEVQISQIQNSVTIKVFYRPDFYPCWTLWQEFTVCTNENVPNANATYHMRRGLGEPDGTIAALSRPMRVGRFFQFRFEITGYCEINGFLASAITVPENVFSPVNQNQSVCEAISCTVTPDLAIYSLQGLPPQPPVQQPIIPPNYTVFNSPVCFNFGGTGPVVFSVTVPSWAQILGTSVCVAPGTFGGTTQTGANNTANTALMNFVNPAIIAGHVSRTATISLGTSGTGYLTYHPGTNTLWTGDSSVAKIFIISLNSATLYKTIDISASYSKVTKRIIYDSVNNQMVVSTDNGSNAVLLFINPTTFAIAALTLAPTTDLNLAYDSNRGNILATGNTGNPGEKSANLISGLTRSVITGVVLADLVGQFVYAPAQDSFYFSFVGTPKIQTMNPTTLGITATTINLPGTDGSVTEYLRQSFLLPSGLLAFETGFFKAGSLDAPFLGRIVDPVAQTLVGVLTGGDVPNNPSDNNFMGDLAYNTNTNQINANWGAAQGFQVVPKFNNSTYAEVSVSTAGPGVTGLANTNGVMWVRYNGNVTTV